MKHILALLLAFVMLFALAACGQKPAEEPGAEAAEESAEKPAEEPGAEVAEESAEESASGERKDDLPQTVHKACAFHFAGFFQLR